MPPVTDNLVKNILEMVLRVICYFTSIPNSSL